MGSTPTSHPSLDDGFGRFVSVTAPINQRLVSIDVLRALAALAVLWHHTLVGFYFIPEPFRFWLMLPKEYGCAGVPLFVVLSGYCIHGAILKNQAGHETGVRVDWWRFWKRRVWRLYPPYLVAGILSFSVYQFTGPEPPMEELRIRYPVWDVVMHLCMVHNLFTESCKGLGNAPMWSLGMEEQLYALYFVFLWLRGRFGLRPTLLITFVIALSWSIGFRAALGMPTWPRWTPGDSSPLALGQWMQWPFAWWFHWALGAAVAEATLGKATTADWKSSWWLIGAGTLIGVCSGEPMMTRWAGSPDPSPIWGFSEFGFGVAAFGLLHRCIRRERAGGFRGRWSARLANIGKMSYSLYLTHAVVIGVVRHLVGPADGRLTDFLTFTLTMIGSFSVAFCLYWFVERHFLFRHPTASSIAQPPVNS